MGEMFCIGCDTGVCITFKPLTKGTMFMFLPCKNVL